MRIQQFSILPVVEACRNSFLAQKLSSLLAWVSGRVERVCSSVLSKSFYAGYDVLDPKVSKERTESLISEHGAFPLECENGKDVAMDVRYIPSNHVNKTGNVIVFAETTSYQDRLSHGLPFKYKYFLDCGADIVLWNPTELQSEQYAQDLLSVLKVLKERRPDQKIVVKGHCATVEPAIAAAADLAQDLNDGSLSLILDRGYADALAFARSFTVFAKIPLIHRLIQDQFSCDGLEKLKTFRGKILFIAPEDPAADQLLYWARRNFTYDMHAWRKKYGFLNDAFIKLGKESDHWSSWNGNEYNEISCELNKMGVIANNYSEVISKSSFVRLPRTFFQRTCLPILTKAWC